MASKQSDERSMVISSEIFFGGASIDPKIGITNAFFDSQSLDFRKQPSQMSVLPQPTNMGGSVVVDLIQAICQANDGTRWAIGNAGNVYKIDTSNVITKIGNIGENGAAGMCYDARTDIMYMTGLTTISTVTAVTTSPVFNAQSFAQFISNSPLVTQPVTFDANNNPQGSGTLRSTATSTYTLPTAILEDSNDMCYFYPDIEPGYSVNIYITSKGTGNWTLTVHDTNNNVIGSVTMTNANLSSGAFNTFKFSSQLRLNINQYQYHFHLTSTVNDGTAQTITAGAVNTLNYQYYSYRLVSPHNGLHPMILFTNGSICIGNERYLAVYDGYNNVDTSSANTVGASAVSTAGYDMTRLNFSPGYEVNGVAPNDEYVVISMEKRSTGTTNTFQDGYLSFWDGAANGPNFNIHIPMGSPQSIYSYQNLTYFICNGALYAWIGSIQILKVRTLDYTDTEYSDINDSIHNYPNMMAIRRGILLFGFPSYTTNTSIKYGVSSWGSIDKNWPQAYGYSYPLSNGITTYTSTNKLTIGCVSNFNDTLYTSWSAVIGGVQQYGIDLTNNSSSPANTFYWKSLIWDGGIVFKEKEALRMKITFLPLSNDGINGLSGTSIQAMYSLDRGAWQYGPAVNAVNATEAFVEINERAREIQFGFSGTSSGTTPATITGVAIEINPLLRELNIG